MSIRRQPARMLRGSLACIIAYSFGTGAMGQKHPPTYSGLAVCPKLSDRCFSAQKTFDPFELPFRLPKRLIDNALYKSVSFYAVVIRKDGDAPCDGGEYSVGLERFRLDTQTRFRDRKIFADHQCPNMGAVSYEFVGERRSDKIISFVAIYAGKSAAEGRTFLHTAQKLYPKATLHKMRVSYSPIVQ